MGYTMVEKIKYKERENHKGKGLRCGQNMVFLQKVSRAV
jgi:hypothetical protein